MARRKKTKSNRSTVKATSLKPRGLNPSISLLLSIIATVALAGIPFTFGKYIELNSPGPYDSGAYVYSAKHLLEGAKLGVEEQASAQPGTLIMNIIGVRIFGFSDTGPKIVQMILQIAAGIFMFYALRRVFGSVAAVLGTTIAAVYLSAPIIAKFGNVKEQFMIAFMIYAGCCMLLYEISDKRLWLFLTGFFALQPFYFKATGASIVLALALYILGKNVISRKWKSLFRELGLFIIGYGAGLVIPALLFIWQKKPDYLIRTFPVIATLAGLVFIVLLWMLVYGLPKGKEAGYFSHLKKVSKKIWLSGLILLVLTFVVSILMIKNTLGCQEGDIASYIQSIPPVGFVKKVYLLIYSPLHKLIAGSGYVATSRSAIEFSKLAPQVMRYYKALSVPVLMAAASIIAAACIGISQRLRKTTSSNAQSRLVWLLAMWWVLDTAFVWISPRSYEQYYLPLCASAAMLSGYVVWVWTQKLVSAKTKMPWLAAGLGGFILLVIMSIPIFIGQRYSPDTGADYIETRKARQRGFAPAMKELPARKKNAWQAVGDYIQTHSSEEDTLYVWGWVPGIYVQAQRLAPVPKAYESDMHLKSPSLLAHEIRILVRTLKKKPPKFIVDTRKFHFPNDRPPLELWPHTYSPKNPLGEPIPNAANVIAEYDMLYKRLLAEKFDPRKKEYNFLLGTTCWSRRVGPWAKAMPDEAQRYDAMKPLRDFVMAHYRVSRHVGPHVLFEYKQ